MNVQNIAKPHQSRPKGTRNTSRPVTTIPCLGRPDQTMRSPGSNRPENMPSGHRSFRPPVGHPLHVIKSLTTNWSEGNPPTDELYEWINAFLFARVHATLGTCSTGTALLAFQFLNPIIDVF